MKAVSLQIKINISKRSAQKIQVRSVELPGCQSYFYACLDVAYLLTLVHACARDQDLCLHALTQLSNQAICLLVSYVNLAVYYEQELKGTTCMFQVLVHFKNI